MKETTYLVMVIPDDDGEESEMLIKIDNFKVKDDVSALKLARTLFFDYPKIISAKYITEEEYENEQGEAF